MGKRKRSSSGGREIKPIESGDEIGQNPLRLANIKKHPFRAITKISYYGVTAAGSFLIFGYWKGREWGVAFYQSTQQSEYGGVLTDDQVDKVFRLPFMIICGFASIDVVIRIADLAKNAAASLIVKYCNLTEERQKLLGDTNKRTSGTINSNEEEDESEEVDSLSVDTAGEYTFTEKKNYIEASRSSRLATLLVGFYELLGDVAVSVTSPIFLMFIPVFISLQLFQLKDQDWENFLENNFELIYWLAFSFTFGGLTFKTGHRIYNLEENQATVDKPDGVTKVSIRRNASIPAPIKNGSAKIFKIIKEGATIKENRKNNAHYYPAEHSNEEGRNPDDDQEERSKNGNEGSSSSSSVNN